MNNNDNNNNNCITRTFIYFHHIKSSQKKKEIIDSANELELYGIWKEGFPGLILCEGMKINIEEYVSRLKRLRWQQMTVKGIWYVEHREFKTFNEVEDMSTFSKQCTENNCQNIYRSSMNLSIN